MKRTIIIGIFGVVLAGSAHAHSITGKVVRIIDGDTIRVHPRDPRAKTLKIRLAGIDAPEKKQAYGQEAKAVLESLILNKEVVIDWKKTDRYGRIIGSIYSHKKAQKNTKSVNAELVMRGLAWVYRKYSNTAVLIELEQRARKQQIGLWKSVTPTPPWRYRRNQK